MSKPPPAIWDHLPHRPIPTMIACVIEAVGVTASSHVDAVGVDLGRDRISVLAIAFAMGIACAAGVPTMPVWPWLTMAAILLVTAVAILLTHARHAAMLCCVAALPMGCAWMLINEAASPADALLESLPPDGSIVTVTGRVTTVPRRTSTASHHWKPASTTTRFTIAVTSINEHGSVAPAHLRIQVRDDVHGLRPGTAIRSTGTLRHPPTPRNPGEFDIRSYFRSQGIAATVNIPDANLITITASPDRPSLAQFRSALRQRASAVLLGNDEGIATTPADSLLAALLLGTRDRQLDELQGAFQRVGLAHLLAISGLHVAAVAGIVLVFARALTRRRRIRGMFVIGVVAMYILLVETRTPVLRAGMMTLAASLGLILGRRLTARGLLMGTAVCLLFWRPDQLLLPGFQMSYGVVLALLHLAPRLRHRWFGPPNLEAGSIRVMLLEWLKSAAASSITAWLTAMPIIVYHFGMVSLYAAPLSIISIPLLGALLLFGLVHMIVGAFLPGLSTIFSAPAHWLADLLAWLAAAADHVPGAVLLTPYPSGPWLVVALACVVIWAMATAVRTRRLGLLCGVACVTWLWWPARPWLPGPILRVDMLAVGNGTCLVVRSESTTVLFDAGSSSITNVGQRLIAPALRRLGVRKVDAIVISHANLDHYSGVMDITEWLPVSRIVVTPQFLDAADSDRDSATAELIAELTIARIPIDVMTAGDTITYGGATWTILHPEPDAVFDDVNDMSAVIRIDVDGQTLLLCGDAQTDAINTLQQTWPDLTADVVELPHHGSRNDAALQWVPTLEPAIVFQSTAGQRLRRDPWDAVLGNTTRLISDRDGACSMELLPDGTWQVGRFNTPLLDSAGR